MTNIHRSLLFSCGLAFVACDSGEGASSVTETGTTTGTPSTTTGEPTTTSPTEGPTGDPSGDPSGDPTGDPCDACAADASCVNGACVCNAGFNGDGKKCDDIDECAGKNDCDIDATCKNTPGSYDCTCNSGYKGNGFTCKDIDECLEGVDNCSPNATCANTDGNYKCTCKDGYTGDGFSCKGSKKFGETCQNGDDCVSGLCLGGDYNQCTEKCSLQVANDCGDKGLKGLCIFIDANNAVCAGDLTFGNDKDDAILKPGDQITRQFQTPTDADLFLVETILAGTYQVVATPDFDDDLQLEFYNGDGTFLGTVNNAGIGGAEAADVTTPGGFFYAIARNIGNSNGSYTISVAKL